MGWGDTPVILERVPVRHVRLSLRIPDDPPDESIFFVLSLLVGAICGYIVAVH